MANHILLLGAGFSRNWGGWLASEAFEYLLGCPQVDDSLRSLLLQHKDKGFEAALEVLQAAGASDARLSKLEAALREMFEAMNRAFQSTKFNFRDEVRSTVTFFLQRFDIIFTLNQDCLLEIHYFNDGLFSEARGRWKGFVVPGMHRVGDPNWSNPAFTKWKPSGEPLAIPPDRQPYIKLHGSSEWESGTTNNLIMGGNKSAAIRQHPILAWGMQQFEERLSRPQTRLMVIGYSFHDDHINAVLMDAVAKAKTTLFIVDPQGMDVLNVNHSTPSSLTISATSPMANALWPSVRGCSRRPLSSTFGSDRAEHANLMRFFAD
jgi:hypothetical protein